MDPKLKPNPRQVNVRLPVELYRWLRREAFRTEKSVAGVVLAAISQYRESRVAHKEGAK